MSERLKKFDQWARAYPVTKLAEDLLHTAPAVYAWLTGRCLPRMETAWRIVELSDGELTLSDVRPDTIPPPPPIQEEIA